MLELEITPEGHFSNAHSRMGWMADDSQLNKCASIIRDVCYTSMPTALNVQEERTPLSLLLAAPYPSCLLFLPMMWPNGRHTVL